MFHRTSQDEWKISIFIILIKMSLTIEQQKELYLGLYDRIVELHTADFKQELIKFTEPYRNKGSKGIVLIDYTDITDMFAAVKDKSFFYEWVDYKDALKIKHTGVSAALNTMNAKKDCVLVGSLSLSLQHYYVNCVKIKDIVT